MTTTLREPAAELTELLRGMLEEHYAVDTDRLTRMTVHAALPQHFGRDMHTLAMQTASVRQRIAETAQALRRMSEGVYGRCEDCDRAIPLGRLRATPQAAQCAPCERRKPRNAYATAGG
jgi:RNA polymerase-binding transcription factor DksA